MLARLDDHVELAQQLAEIVVDKSPNMLQRLRTAVAEGAADEVRRAAHALKGSLSNFIDGGPTATACEMESMGRDGRLEETPRALERLEGEIAGLTVRLREFQSTRAKAS